MGRLKKILTVSPNSDFLREQLSELKSAFDVQHAASAEAADFLSQEWHPEVIVFDHDTLGEPIRSLIVKLAAKCGFVAVARLQAKELVALRSGVDSFAVITLEASLLIARIQAIVKRIDRPGQLPGLPIAPALASANTSPIRIDELIVYPQDFIVKRSDQVLSVTPTQFKLLMTFLTKQDQLLSRQWLKETVWDNAEISLRSIDAQISKLKKMVPELDQYLVNIYGKGYVFSAPKRAAA